MFNFPRIRFDELSLFSRQLWTLQRAGIPLISSLNSLKDATRNPALKKIISDVILQIEGGSPFSEALARHPFVFSPLYVHMVKAGEASGKMDEVLLRLSQMLEFEAQTRERIRSAMMYPAITFVSLLAAFLMIVTVVMPQFAALYSNFKSSLPLPTRILIGLNGLIRDHGLELALITAAAFFLSRYVLGTPAGHYWWDRLKLKIPVFGPLGLHISMSRFSATLAELLASGVPMLQSLDLVSETVGNEVIRRTILEIKKSVNEGRGMSEPMKESGFFSPLVIQMTSVGEQSGKTEELLRHVCAYYEDLIQLTVKNLTTAIEPFLVVLIGCLATLLAVGVFLPLWDIIKIVK